MVTLVVCENGKATDVTTTTNRYLHCDTKNKYYGWLQFIGFMFFLIEEELFSKKNIIKNSMRITYHCWTESMILSLLDLQEGQLFPQYYYVSNYNKHVSKKDEERTNIWTYYSGFC